MARLAVRAAAAACALIWTAALGAQPEVRLAPGNWRVKVTSTTNGVADPAQDDQVCIREDELKDLARYFAPVLEGVPAKCTTTRRPTASKSLISHRLRCKGNGFTYDLESTVTIASPEKFLTSSRSEARTAREFAVVVGNAEGVRLGPCPTQ